MITTITGNKNSGKSALGIYTVLREILYSNKKVLVISDNSEAYILAQFGIMSKDCFDKTFTTEIRKNNLYISETLTDNIERFDLILVDLKHKNYIEILNNIDDNIKIILIENTSRENNPSINEKLTSHSLDLITMILSSEVISEDEKLSKVEYEMKINTFDVNTLSSINNNIRLTIIK